MDAQRHGHPWHIGMSLIAVLAMLAAACAVEDSTDQSDDQPSDVVEERDVVEPSEPEAVEQDPLGQIVFTEQDCAEEILRFGDHLDEMDAILASLVASLDAGQLSQADSDHGHLSGHVIVALDLHESWHDYCEHVQRMRDCAGSRLPPLLAKAAAAGR